MNSDEEACAVTRGLIDIELGLCYGRDEVDQPFETGGDDDPLVQRLGRPEFERRRVEADRLHAERCPTHSPSAGPAPTP